VFKIRVNKDGYYRKKWISEGRSRKVVIWIRDYLGLKIRETVEIAFENFRSID
jgi:hypothetical protein